MAARSFHVVVAGGGVAGLEALLALGDLDDGRLRFTLVSPQEDFVVRAHRVLEPFDAAPAPRVPLDRLTGELGADHLRAGVRRVRPADRRVELDTGDDLSYDALLLALGARPRPALAGALNFDGSRLAAREFGGTLRRAKAGELGSLAFVVPPRSGWTLPAYELALMAARTLGDGAPRPRITLVTPEEAPLELFGPAASAAADDLLAEARIEFAGGSYATRCTAGRLHLSPGARSIEAEVAVALPVLEGPHLDGVPRDTRGFLPVDAFGRVGGLEAVYAAGDGTDFPIKQGGLAAQQADAAAQQIGARAGLWVTPSRFRPVLRGRLLTGRGTSRFLRTTVAGGDGLGAAAVGALWWPPAKVSGRYLGPWLAAHGAVDWTSSATAGLDIELALTVRNLPVTVDLEPHDQAPVITRA